MKAAVRDNWGGPEQVDIRDVETPKPNSGDMLIKVHSSTVTRSDDCLLYPIPGFVRLFMGIGKPRLRILGMDFAGEIVEIGSNVSRFSVGDRVFGLSAVRYGAHAEYLCVSEDSSIAHIPDQISYNEAVVCEGAWYANNNLRKMNPKPGKKMLVYGASGAIGTAAVQLARYYGAEVTAVVGTPNLELAEKLGASQVIDYMKSDFTDTEERYDGILDAVGKTSYRECRKLLKPDGIFTATEFGPWLQNAWYALSFALVGRQRVYVALPTDSKEFVNFIAKRMAASEYQGVFDRNYRLDEIVDAYHYVHTEQKTGIVGLEISR